MGDLEIWRPRIGKEALEKAAERLTEIHFVLRRQMGTNAAWLRFAPTGGHRRIWPDQKIVKMGQKISAEKVYKELNNRNREYLAALQIAYEAMTGRKMGPDGTGE